MEENKNIEHNFTLTEFKNAYKDIIAVNEESYKKNHLFWERVKPVRRYEIEDVIRIIETGDIIAQRELSQNYFVLNGYYRQIITYYATIIKYYGILIPHPSNGKSLQDSNLEKRYRNANSYVDKMDLKNLGPRIAYNVLLNGTYYGMIVNLSKDNFTVVDLPPKYCRARFVNSNNDLVVEFNVQYFDSIKDPNARKSALKLYPDIVRSKYNSWKKNGKGVTSWIILPSEIGFAFNLFNERPYFLSVIPSTIEYQEAVDNELERQLEEIKKILINKIPHLNDGRLLFEPLEAQVMHDGIVNMLKTSNPHVSVLTTYGDVDLENTKTNDSVTNNTLENMNQNVFANIGVSSEIFAATGSSTLGVSIKYDTALMMHLANKIGKFVSHIINILYGNTAIKFTYNVLPITYYNDTDYIDSYLKMANSGYSLLMPAIAVGLSVKQLDDLKDLENDVLKLGEKLIPLETSYTQSAGASGAETGKVGRPALAEEEKSEKTLRNEVAAENNNN